MTEIRKINNTKVMFTTESKALPSIPAISTLSIASAFEKEHKNVMRDFREAIVKLGKLTTEPTHEDALYKEFNYKDKQGKTHVAMAVSEKLFYQVALAYKGDLAFKLRKEFIEAFYVMKEKILLQQEEIASLKYNQLLVHSNKSKGQNNRHKDKLKVRIAERDRLLKEISRFVDID